MNRVGFLGGSDVAAVLGESRFGCAVKVWLQKRGEKGQDPPPSKHLERGTKLEDFVAQEWALDRQREITRWHFVAHSEHKWAGANIDRRILKDPRGIGVFEAKVPSKFVWLSYRREGLPEGYILQGQWYLFVTGYTWGAYGIFNAELMEFADEGRAPFEFQRNEKLIAAVWPKMEIFWNQVTHGPSPEPLASSDRRCAGCEFRMRCHGEAVAFEDAEGKATVSEDPALIQAIRDYAEFGQIEKAAAEEKQAARELARALVAPGKTTTPAGSISLGPPVKRFSLAAVAAKYPRLAKRLEAQFKVPDTQPFFGIYPKKEKV